MSIQQQLPFMVLMSTVSLSRALDDVVVMFPNELNSDGEAHVLGFSVHSHDGLPFCKLRGHFGMFMAGCCKTLQSLRHDWLYLLLYSSSISLSSR